MMFLSFFSQNVNHYIYSI